MTTWLPIVSLVTGIVSIVLAIFSIVTAYKTETRIIKICKKIRKLIDGQDDEN